MKNTEQAATTLNKQLPQLLANSETALDDIAQLADEFGDYEAMMGVVHAAKQEKSLFSYGSSILSFLEGQPATIGHKKSDGTLKAAVPARAWASRAKKDVPALSVAGSSKADVLHGLVEGVDHGR